MHNFSTAHTARVKLSISKLSSVNTAMLLAGIAGSAVFCSPAMGQVADVTPRTALDDIVVVAQKRAENLQDVPVAETVISSKELQDQHITQFNELSRLAPSLTVNDKSGGSTINVRGVGTFAFSPGVESSVAVVIDDLSVIQQAQAFSDINDVAQVEVLSGPQGTLFGKSSSAGLINITTKGPTAKFAADAELLVTDDHQIRGEASISGPLSDQLQYSLSGYSENRRGYTLNVFNGHKLNDDHAFGGRGKLKWQIQPNFAVTLNANYFETKSNGTVDTLRSVPVGTLAGPNRFGDPFDLGGVVPSPSNLQVNLDNDQPMHSKTGTISTRAVLGLGAADLISISGYQDWRQTGASDVDQTAQDVTGEGGINALSYYHAHQFSQEFRLVSRNPGPLHYLVGAYYADAATSRNFNRGPVFILADFAATTKTRSLAAFTQLDYDITHTTRLSGGLRVNNERIAASYDNFLPTATLFTCANNPLCSSNASQTAVTWKVALEQHLSNRILAYVFAASGYKGQAYDVTSSYNQTAAQTPVKAERSKDYEIGLKSRFWDNRAQLNVAGFLTNYDNFQAQGGVDTTDSAGRPVLNLVLENVGRLRTKGIEVSSLVKPVPWLQLSADLAYIDAKIISYPTASCSNDQLIALGAGLPDPRCALITGASGKPTSSNTQQNLAGVTLPNSPKFKGLFAATADFPLTPQLRGLVSMSYSYQSSVHFDLFNDALTYQGGYGVFNGSIGLRAGSKGQYKLTVYANNLFDKRYATDISNQSVGFFVGGRTGHSSDVLTQSLPRDAHRYIGLKFGFEY